MYRMNRKMNTRFLIIVQLIPYFYGKLQQMCVGFSEKGGKMIKCHWKNEKRVRRRINTALKQQKKSDIITINYMHF